MGAAAGIMGGLQLGQAYLESEGIKAEGRLQKTQADFNARMAETQAEDALFRGEKKAHDVKRAGKQFGGEQKVAYGAQGVDVSVGTPTDVMASTREDVGRDIEDVKNNAWRESFGYRSQAADYRMAGRYAKYSARNRARNTLISGGLGAGSSFAGGMGKGK